MKIIKRNGKEENIKFDKVLARIKKQTYGLDSKFIEPVEVAQKVISGLYDGVTSKEVDTLAAETAASMTIKHPDYSILASRIAITSLYKETDKSFSKTIDLLYRYINPKTNEQAGMISDEVYKFIMDNAEELDSAIITDRDFLIDYFGFKTLERAYLLKLDGKVAETPQFMWMRVSAGIWCGNVDEVIKTYDLMSQKYFTHATPTLFNSGTKRPQLSSCFLVGMKEDSIKGIYETLSDIAVISQNAGGIGLHVHNVRGSGAYIKGTNGNSNGLVPMLRVFNETARYVDQGGNKRKGSFSIYLEPWHSDIYDFLDLRKNHGKEEMRTRDLFTALWIPDLFMEKVNNDEEWYLFSPDEAPGLSDVVGDNFVELYNKYIEEGKFRKVVKARDLWDKIIESQMETGTPYMLAKDAANLKSNQQNLGVIKSSNLCCEIIEYSDDKEQAVCNLASIALSMFVDNKKKDIDYQKLYDVTYQVTVNLNKVIDINYYPTKETKRSNNRHRPIGIGIQGLADVYAKLGLPFDCDKAKEINKNVFETMYFASMTASKDLAIKDGSYETFKDSPLSKGIFQFDMWTDNTIVNTRTEDGKSVTNISEKKPIKLSGMWDWETLRKEVMEYGVRNSLLFAPMPTASTSQILGNNEAFEPFTSNIYKRNTLSGEFVMVNKHLVIDLIKLGLWTDEIRNKIILAEGSVQSIDEIPQNIKYIYKTVWEIKLRDQIDMSADRGAFVCQSQSFNLHVADINKAKITTALMYGWRKGLKTLSYYIRGKSITNARKDLGIDSTYKTTQTIQEQIDNIACSLDNPEDCIACSA
jgi:ribonucleoside-diphosphate reductase alpha chain